jgi:hypothetical protein
MTISIEPAEKGKYKVLVNYIQQGIDYSSKELAEKEAEDFKRNHVHVGMRTCRPPLQFPKMF